MQTILVNEESWENQRDLIIVLSRAYAIQFWAGSWKELVCVRDADGQVEDQYGTFDSRGEIYPETLDLLRSLEIDSNDSNWPEQLWERACAGEIRASDGRTLEPYWTLTSAQEALRTFVTSVDQGGFGGELLVAVSGEAILGFTAYACHPGEVGLSVANRRFPVRELHIPVNARDVRGLDLQSLLLERFGRAETFGIFLDHAVSELHRGNGLGSKIFDARLDRLMELGATVIVGRTMTTAPAQYIGNYMARGLVPIAADGTDAFSRDKHYFAVSFDQIRPRTSR